jgi:hypothetical protein
MEKLPDELLIAVFDCLSVDDDASDPTISPENWPSPPLHAKWYSTWALCRVNKRFHRIVNARLYSTYRFSVGHPELFLRTISTSPGLASCVKRIIWGIGRDSSAFQRDLLTSGEKRQIVAGLRHLEHLSATRLADRFTDLVSSDSDLYLSTILLFTPLIEELFIDGTNDWAWKQSWLKLATANPQYLAKLRKVTVRGHPHIRNILPLLTVPTLRTLRVTRVGLEIGDLYFETRPQYIEWDADDELRRPSNDEVPQVEDIHLAGPYLQTVGGFFGYAKRCGNLKSFHVEWTGTGSNHRPTAYKALIRLFDHHLERLEHISIRDATRDHVDSAAKLLSCLRGIKRLRSLTINLINFLPWGRGSRPNPQVPNVLQVHHLQEILISLPKSIEDLNLCMDGTEVFDGDVSIVGSLEVLLKIAPTIRTILPALQRFATVGWHPFLAMFPCQTKRAALQETFVKAGVTYVSQPHSELEIRDDIYCLNYVERDWVWVQPATRDTLKWKKGFGRNDLDWVCLHTVFCWKEEEEDDWMNITTIEERGTRSTTESSDMVMDQYMAEQPLWYWEKLQARRSHIAPSS